MTIFEKLTTAHTSTINQATINDQLRLPHFVLQPSVQARTKVNSQVQGHDSWNNCWTAGKEKETIVTAGLLD
jgi:hypothetical protein